MRHDFYLFVHPAGKSFIFLNCKKTLHGFSMLETAGWQTIVQPVFKRPILGVVVDTGAGFDRISWRLRRAMRMRLIKAMDAFLDRGERHLDFFMSETGGRPATLFETRDRTLNLPQNA
jgi:hypothetical protein